ncbi:NUDIX domain-containing protein [Streptomyces sp. NPDC126514]|uniref:NUDIX domain-containing protein n=1 Tax=Streptomyces sp. NPDC126514 TaxID=3155210 RepID=UPI0033207041
MIRKAVYAYLGRHPDKRDGLAALKRPADVTTRATLPGHVTCSAVVIDRQRPALHIRYPATGLMLTPGGHLEPFDATLVDATLRELAKEIGVHPRQILPTARAPVCVEYDRVLARPAKGEPEHHQLDFRYAFTTRKADVGQIQEPEVTGAGWYPRIEAAHLVGHRIQRATIVPGPTARSEAR